MLVVRSVGIKKGRAMTFYNRYGLPIAYEDNGIYLFNGKPVAYFDNSAVYAYNGKQLGWFENGWIRDLDGRCVFFTRGASGFGPLKPLTKLEPLKSLKQVKPMKFVKQDRKVRSVDQMAWSQLSGEVFFAQ